MSPDNALHSDGPRIAGPAGERGRQARRRRRWAVGDSIPWRVLRHLYAASYLFVGTYFALSLAGVIAPLHLKVSGASAAFHDALGKTGFSSPCSRSPTSHRLVRCVSFAPRLLVWYFLHRLRSSSSLPTRFSIQPGFSAHSVPLSWQHWLGTFGLRFARCFLTRARCKLSIGPDN